ncbi:MAG: DUF4238 domain-containing protein [Pedosphaera sp.]|nr:DUF4238 domain-containing protein [Pedosphaera sp.]
MAEYKNQHYVPQFYLRAFSFDGGKNTALFNFKQNKIIPSSNIDGQCAEDYFYGKDPKPEKALGAAVEAPASKVIGKIISSSTVPKTFTEDCAVLFAFTLFQHGRTLYASEEGAEFFRAAIEPHIKRMALESGELTADEINAVEIGLERPANLTLATSAQMLPLILDLRIKLLINQTSQDFITSDHPVAKMNQYFLGAFGGGVAGWAAKGLQVFLPLSPKHTVMMYDDKIYRVGARKSDIVPIVNESDVNALNTLQLLNAHQNVYFLDSRQGPHISKLFENCRNRRNKDKVGTRFFDTADDSGAPLKGQQTYRQNLDFRELLSFCKVQTAKKQIPPEDRGYGLRQPELVSAHKKFLETVDVGRYKEEEWIKFLDDMKSSKS